MVDSTIPRGAVVVGIDGSPSAAEALRWAATQAVHEGRALVLAHAIPALASTWLDLDGRDNRIGVTGRRSLEVGFLDEAREQAERNSPGLELHEVLRVAEPEVLLTELGTEASMVVVGSRGLGPARSLLLGSVGRSLTRHPPCPVVVHRPRPHETPSSELLVGVDGSARSKPVLEVAFRLADQRRLSIRLLHCHWQTQTVTPGMWSEPGPATSTAERQEVAQWVSVLSAKYPEVPVATEVLRGPAQALLSAASEDEAMIVIGAHHPGLSGLLPYSVTTSLLEHARCPVAVVPVS